MENSLPFSVLNERLRPRFTAMDRLCYSVTTLEKQPGLLRRASSTSRPTDLSAEPEPGEPVTSTSVESEPEESVTLTSVEPDDDAEQEDPISDEYLSFPEDGDGLLTLISQCLNIDDLNPMEENNVPSLTELTDGPDSRTAEEYRPVVKEDGSPSRRSYTDGTLPDLIRSGRPLIRRRTLGPVSDTLKEVRREVELSRRRSLRLKAQVDRLQENRDGAGWGQHRARVTEDVLSILRLLLPLAEPESSVAVPSTQENHLDAALSQLQNVARQLAISYTKQEFTSGKPKDSAVLQQALWDRDEAVEKKKAMETELLRSKTEMMTLNNQLLEAVQKRLELSLELEAWKEDIQFIVHQQLLSQQQAEDGQKRPSRLGLLKRTSKPIQRPTSFPLAPPTKTTPTTTTPSTNGSQIFISKPAPYHTPAPKPAPASPPRSWRDRLRRGKVNRRGSQDAAGQEAQHQAGSRNEGGFHNVSLD